MASQTVFALIPALTLGGASAFAQAVAPEQTPSTPGENETIVLSPFQVDTTKDKGYKATNATSGTRLNTAIKDAPLPIEVITNEFMRDIGATNLREALQYSAGVILQSQSDALNDPQGGQDLQPGSAGANNPQGATGSNSQTGTKLRGFIVDQTLRDGFRRQFASDWINIERIEVVRGPEALLYGVGSFGGVYNYVPKRPLQEDRYYASAAIGTHDYKRAELDATGPLGDGTLAWKPAYRLTAAWQENGDYTEWYQNNQFFVSPVFSFRPFKNTEVVIDNEFGTQRQEGNGFQSVRLASPGSGAQHRMATFWPDSNVVDLRTYRMSGPDTFLDTKYRNHVIDITQKVTDDLYFRAGVSYNIVERESADVTSTGFVNAAEAFQSSDPLTIRPDGLPRRPILTAVIPDVSLNSILAGQLDPDFTLPPPREATFRYKWEERDQEEERLQYRVEGNYSFEAWGKHSLLVGVQSQYREEVLQNRGQARTYTNFNPSPMIQYSYRNPYDIGAIRRGFQGDGLPDPALVDLDWNEYKNWDLGYYAAYQGKFFNERLTLIGGYRYDRNDARSISLARDSGRTGNTSRDQFSEEAPHEYSPQIGASVRVTKGISVFGVYSTGLIPNYNQPDGNGSLEPTTAENIEYGVKFDMLDGRISGTISAFKIERENTPRNIWWAPAPYKAPSDPTDPSQPRAALWQFMSPENLWWAIKNTPNGLAVAKEIFPSGWHTYLERMDATPAQANGSPEYSSASWGSWGDPTAPADAWNFSGGHLYGDATNNTHSPDVPSTVYWPLINLDIAAHQQFAINALESMGTVTPGAQWNWAGSFYDDRNGQRLRYGNGTIGVRNIPHYTSAAVPINDESKGYDAQFIITPTDNWQILLNYAYVKRQITSQTYKYVKTPYYLPLAQYYYPLFGWGTLDSRPASEAYADTTDTSTFQVPIPEFGQSLDDTPKHQASVWSNYRFEGDLLKGFGFGIGARWEDKRQYYSGFAVDGTANAITVNGRRVYTQFWTKERWTVDMMVDYTTKVADKYNLRVALNISNLLDDQGRYGFIFAPGMAARLTTSISF